RIKAEFPFVYEVTKCAAEVAIADLRQAINTYYKTKEANPKSKVKFPGRRKRSKKIGGFGLNNDKFSVSGHTFMFRRSGKCIWPKLAGSMAIYSTAGSKNEPGDGI